MLSATPATARGSNTCKQKTCAKIGRKLADGIRRWEAMTNFLELVTVPLLFALSLGSLDADLLVVLLQGCEIFARLGEFTFFSIVHPLCNLI